MERKTYQYISGWEVRGLESGSLALEYILKYCNAALRLVLKYCRAVLILGLDLRLTELKLDSYSA
jgi:hypothetical protein